MQLNARIKHKRDTASNWATKNPTPLDGEIIIVETTDGNTKVKVGDGSTAYNNLPFMNEDLTIQVSENTSNISTLKNTKVTGVTSSKDGNVVVFDGTGGRLIKDSGKSLADYLLNEEILEATNRVSDVEVNQSVATIEALQTAVARLEANQSSAKHNVGEEWHSYTGKIPEGGVPYCGQEVTRVTYADLWAYAQAQGLVKSETEWQSIASAQGGSVPFYSNGDGNKTFRMPKIVGYVKGASSQSESGDYIAEGLPNISGTFGGYTASSKSISSGAFTDDVGTYNGPKTIDQNSEGRNKTTFDASRSNDIYGNSEHVTPETSVVMFGVYAFGEITNQGVLDAETLATGLATLEVNKADKTQWVAKYLMASTNTTLGTFTLDLSSYLPTDDDYEVLVKIHVSREDSSGTNTNMLIIYGEGGYGVVQAVADGANFQQNYGSGVVPLNRKTGLTYKLEKYSPDMALVELFGYKRVN